MDLVRFVTFLDLFVLFCPLAPKPNKIQNNYFQIRNLRKNTRNPQYEHKEFQFQENYFRFGILYPENIFKNTGRFLIRGPPKPLY